VHIEKSSEKNTGRALRWLRARAADLDHIGSEERFPWRVVLLAPALMILAEAYWPALYLRVEDTALQIAAPLIPEGSPDASWITPKQPQAAPTVLLIDDEAFEGRFRERSPLDRHELAKLFDEVRRQDPKLLVVDLDLSPGPAPSDDDRRAQEALDEALKAYAPGRLLIATPLPVRSYELALRRLQWMHELCSAGARFAHTALFRSGSHVLRYDPTLPSLGPVAARMAGVPLDEPQEFDEPEPCALVAQEMLERSSAQPQPSAGDGERPAARMLGAAYFLQAPPSVAYHVDNEQARRLVPINFGYERFVRRRCLSPTVEDDDCAPFADGDAKDRVVFLGGSWGDEDRHMTPTGRREGVMLHAAAFHSEQVRISDRYKPLAAAAEVALGLIVAFLMGNLWHGYFKALYGEPQTLHLLLTRYAYAALATVLVVGLLWVIAQSSGWLMQHGVWLDPLPLLGVLMLKTFFSARKVELHTLGASPEHAAPAAAPLKWYDQAARVIDAVPRIAANQLKSLAVVVSALPPVHRHWPMIERLWKKLIMAASLLLLAWALFILLAG